jgi:transposase
MYLRHTTVTKRGKTHTYWRLVRSVRCGHRVRQETVAQLGELDAQGRIAARCLAERLAGVERQPGLFDEDLSAEPIPVDLRGLRLERSRRFGDVWLAWRLWQAVGLDQLLEQVLPRGREDVPWATVAAVLVIARLCEPSSELHIAEDWFRRTALDDLLQLSEAKVNGDRCYRGLDRLLAHKETLEKHLKERLGTLFALDYDLLLYDVTSTYFEGLAEANPLAQRGHSRDHRSDCKQVCIGLVVTRDGFPLGFEVFAGNRHDSTTLREIVQRMEERYGQSSRVWALDRGMVSEAHLAWLRERGSRYIVGTPKAQLRAYERQLLEGEWLTIRDGLQVQKVPTGKAEGVGEDEGVETLILCRSANRAAKEQAMRERFAERLEAGLTKLAAACAKRRCELGGIERRLGRLLQRQQRAARFYDVRVTADEDGRAALTWSKRAEAWQQACACDGCYVLRSNVTDWTAEDLWRAYIQLTEAEAAFRIQKESLQLRPVWHQKAERVTAHILVCFLAYVLRKTLDGWCRQAGLGSSAATVLEELARIQSTDVVLPTKDNRQVRLRCVVRPDRAQTILLDRPGVAEPLQVLPGDGVQDLSRHGRPVRLPLRTRLARVETRRPAGTWQTPGTKAARREDQHRDGNARGRKAAHGRPRRLFAVRLLGPQASRLEVFTQRQFDHGLLRRGGLNGVNVCIQDLAINRREPTVQVVARLASNWSPTLFRFVRSDHSCNLNGEWPATGTISIHAATCLAKKRFFYFWC